MRTLVPTIATGAAARPSRARLLLLLLAGVGALLVLAGCGEVDNTTEVATDGSGTQTLTVRIGESDMDRIDGGADTVEATIEEHNPGLEYQGTSKDGTDTLFTMTLEFGDAEDYAAKVQPVLEAGELGKTAEVTFTPPSPPFSSGYTLTRNFTGNDLTRWAVKALVDAGKIEDADDGDIDNALDQGEVTVTVEEAELDQKNFIGGDEAAVWSNAEAVGFDSVAVVTAGAEDPEANSYTRTLTYELARETYLDATDDFDAFFAEATPEGGELAEAGETGTTWTITFPAGTAEQVAAWTDTALATSGSAFSVEAGPDEEDPFSIDTRVVDTIECPVACGEMGTLTQALEVPVGFSGSAEDVPADPDAAGTEEIALDGGTEPQTFTRSIVFTSAAYDLTVNRDGGGEITMALTLPAADDEIVTEENVVAFLGEGAERSSAEDEVTYTLTAEAEGAEDFSGALQRLGFEGVEGPPAVNVTELDGGRYRVSLAMGPGGDLYGKLGGPASWTIQGDGLRPTSIESDEIGNASLGEDAITADQAHGVVLTFSAERTGLGVGAIVAILAVLAVLGLLLTAAVIAFLHRGRIKAMLGGDPAPDAAAAGPAPAPGQDPGDERS